MIGACVFVSGFRAREVAQRFHLLPPRRSTPGRWFPSRRRPHGGMASSVYFGRNNGFAEKPHLTNGLPTYSSAVLEKRHRGHHSVSWMTPVSLPIPGVRTRRLRLMVPSFSRLHQASVTRFGRRKGSFILGLGFMVFFYFIFAVHRRFGSASKSWPPISFPDPSTLVYRRDDLQHIWEWEIAAGHYPSGRRSTCHFRPQLTFNANHFSSTGANWPCQSSAEPRAATSTNFDAPITLSWTYRDRHAWPWSQPRLPGYITPTT